MDLTVAESNSPNEVSPPGKLRILFVPWDRFPPFRPAAKAIFLTELPRRGHRVDWLIQSDESSPEAITSEIEGGIAYIGATDPGPKLLNRLRKHFLNFKHTCRMLYLVRRNRYDLIQAKDNVGAAIVGLLVARISRIRFFYWIAYPIAESYIYEGKAGFGRYPFLNRIRGHVLKILLYRVILPRADHVFVQSEQMKKDIVAAGIAPEMMTPIPSSVDLNSVPYLNNPTSQTILEKGKNSWVVYLGTLKRVRNLDFIIRSFSRVLGVVPNSVLIIIGKGDTDADLQRLRDEAKNLGIDKSVVFTGFLAMTDGWEYIRQADVCLSPYFPTPILKSTSPTKLIEYMGMGKPVVANDHPEQSLVIEESKAGLCVPWEEQAFADAVIQLLSNPDKAMQMGKRGRQYVEQYRTNQAMGDIVERIYWRFARCDIREQ